MSVFKKLNWKIVLIFPIARALAKSYYLTQVARLVVRAYDNDCNADMYKNEEAKLLNMISSTRGDDSIFVDVGANVGDWSAALIEGGYTGRLVVIDPLKRNLAKVRERLGALDYDNFDLCEYALSDRTGTARFFSNKDQALSGHDSLLDMREIGYSDELDCVEVQCTTLDELAGQLKILRIDFLKIDVEGNELSVLQGAKSSLSTGAIDFIQIEFGHAARAAGVYLHDIINFVNEYDYKIFVIKPSGLLPLDFTPFTENQYSYINFLLAQNSVLDELEGHILSR
jgi:FkbM family methyltransferase